ncbi:MAG TPA: urea amidolyase associated protein UAAP1 [Polyangiales bacterium]|nr:urea amidolyase associated protein UAAP1 [Polyangiales bacterium]
MSQKIQVHLHGGQMWSRVMRHGQLLTLTDVEGGATPAALFYNAVQPLERYNMADTLKAQHTARLTRGHVLYSDMGRVLMSIVEDSAGWHDTFTGHMDHAASLKKYGEGTFQKLRNGFYRDTRSNFLIELGKHGLGKRDLVPNVNFFTKVSASEDGALRFEPASQAGRSVTLRADMDTLVILSNTPHALDPSPSYAPKPLLLTIEQGPRTVAKDDVCRTQCEQNGRGFELTEDYNLGA